MSTCPPKKVCKDATTCEPQFKDKLCKCVITPLDCETFKTICAYEEGGYLYPCSVGCCQNQCDNGQCPGDSRPSIKLGEATMTYPKDTGKYVLAIVVLLVALIIISTLSL
jgi:hypothetical protein